MNTKNINRRSFVCGAGALFVSGSFFLGSKNAFAIPHGQMPKVKPNLTLGILSDIHFKLRKKNNVDVFSGQDVFRKALEFFRDNGADGVAVCGDMADHGNVAELNAVGRTWFQVFPDNKAPDGRHVEPLFVYGNHDNRRSIGKDPAAAWKKAFSEDYQPIWSKNVKGYLFVGAHWVKGGCRGRNETGVLDVAPYLKENASKIDPSKPFFLLQHPPAKNTCHGPWHWGHDDGRLTKALSKYPNAIALTGHSHASINDERAIWQGEFTAINAGSLSYTGLEYGDLSPSARENDGGVARKVGSIMKRMPTSDGHQGMIARIYDDKIIIERRDFEDLEVLGPDWVIPLPLANSKAMTFAPRAKASRAPEFAPGAKLSIKVLKSKDAACVDSQILEVMIPPAISKDDVRVFDYEIEVRGTEGGCDRCYVYAEGFHRSLASKRTKSPTQCCVPFKRLTAKGKLSIKVSPRNSFGKSGRPIEQTI